MLSMITPPVRSLVALVAVLAAVTLVASCGTSAAPASPPPASTPTTTGRTDASGTVWLCRPGLADDPCLSNLTTTVVRADGKRSVERVRPT
jgi:hypothetical protein